MRWIDWRASSSRRSCARSSSSALRRSSVNLLLLPRHAVRRVAGRGHLQVVADDGLFLAMELGLERGDRGFGRGDRHVEAGRLLEQPDERRVPGVGALAQLLDLALGRQDAARLVARAPFDPVRAAEDFAVARDGGAAGLARQRPWPRHSMAATRTFADLRADRVRRRAADDPDECSDAGATTRARRPGTRTRDRGTRDCASTTTKPTRPAARSRTNCRPAAASACVRTTTC